MNLLYWILIALGPLGLALVAELAAAWYFRRSGRRASGRSQAPVDPLADLLEPVSGPLEYRLKPNTDCGPLLQTNRWGLRGADLAPDGQKFRIWVLGELDCFGAGLPQESDLWLYQLQALLEKHGLDDYEVVNLSLGGYNNAQRLALWKQMPALPGDVLLLRPGFHEILTCASSVGSACPLTAGAPRAPRLAAEQSRGWRRWMERSALLRLAGEAWLKLRSAPTASSAVPCAVSSRACWNNCREAILLTVEEIVADAESKGVRPAAMSFFPAYQLEMSDAERRRLSVLETPDCRVERLPVAEQFDLMDATVERLVCQKGLPLVDLAPAFWQRPDRFSLYLDPVHLNAAGHRVLAETLLTELVRTGLLTPDPLALPTDSVTAARHIAVLAGGV